MLWENFQSFVEKYTYKRNWHYTMNRRLRKGGWDIRPWPNNSKFSGFTPELVDLINQASPTDLEELQRYFNGVSRIVSRGGNLFSQLGQEALVLAYTENVSRPFYLEIGAFHPYKYSNTATLREVFEWEGCSVDPSSETFESFAAAGLSQRLVNKGVAPDSGLMYLIENGAFSRTSDSQLNNAIPVEVIGIKHLIKTLPVITYLSLDIEGGEFEILKAYPWSESRPIVITVEHNQDTSVEHAIDELLISLNYKRVLSSLSCFESWYVDVRQAGWI